MSAHMQPNPLPPSFQFFGIAWWILHIVVIGFVYMAGFKAGKKKGMNMAAGDATTPIHQP